MRGTAQRQLHISLLWQQERNIAIHINRKYSRSGFSSGFSLVKKREAVKLNELIVKKKRILFKIIKYSCFYTNTARLHEHTVVGS